MQFQDETRDARCVLHRWVLEAGGGPVGYSELTQSSETYRPCSYKVKVGLLPEYQDDPSLLEALFQPVLDAFRHYRGVSMGCILKEESSSLAELLKKHGFEPGMRFMVNVMDLRELSLDPSAMNLPAPPGISIVSLSEARSDPLAHRKLFALDQAIRRDAPHPEEATMRFDFFDRSVLGHPDVLPDGYFIAMEGQEYVGLCSLARRDVNKMAYVMLTGVLPSHRKRGIALALKAASLKYTYQAGFRNVYTTNEEGNRRIIELNHRFGFKPVGTWICWSKSL